MLTQVCNSVWKVLNASKTYSFIENPLPVFAVLFKLYMQSAFEDFNKCPNAYAKLLGELLMECEFKKDIFFSLENILGAIDMSNLESFHELVEFFVHRYSETALHGEYVQPEEVTRVAYYLMQGEYCEENAIYNPFAGLGSFGIVHNEKVKHEVEDSDIDMVGYYHYYAGEINKTISLIGQVRLIASGLVFPESFHFLNEDSLGKDVYDGYQGGWAVIATPPFGMKTTVDNTGKISKLEEIIVEQFIKADGFHRAAYILPKSICFDKSFSKFRENLVKQNLIETVAELPNGIFNTTSISTVVLVLSKDRHKDDLVLFIDGSKWFKETKTKVLDDDLFLSKVWGYWNEQIYNSNEMAPVKSGTILSHGCLLLPGIYVDIDVELLSGQQLVRLGDLIEVVQGEDTDKSEGNVLPFSVFSDDINVIFKGNQMSSDKLKNHLSYKDADFVLSLLQDKIKVCKCSRNKQFYANSNQVPFRVKSPLVYTDYLIYAMLNSQSFRNLAYLASGTTIRTTRQFVRFIMDFQITIDSLEIQEKVLSKLKDEYTLAKQEEYQAEMQRLGIRTATSDLSHMLGMTFDKVGNNISYMLEADLPQDIKESLYALNDNFEYMKRFISTVGADFTASSISKVEVGVNEFINSYLQSWGNFGNIAFTLNYDSRVMDDTTFCIDKGMMRVLFDTVLDNAYRHGFNKQTSLNNRVVVSSSCSIMNDQEYVLITIANNGSPLAKDFSLKKYVSRGVYVGNSGRTGLGGNHIYSIVKRHNGYLNVSSSAAWSVIIELLIPVELYSEAEENNFESYGNADKCL